MILRALVTTGVLVLAAPPAAAHGGLPGGGGFLAGALHPLVAIEHLILLLGLGLVSGQLPPAGRRPGFAAVGLGVLGGLAASGLGGWSASSVVPVAILGLAVLTGIIVAFVASRLPPAVVPPLGAMIGLAVGLDTELPRPSEGGAALLVAPVAGVLTGVYLIVLDAAALAAIAAARPPLPIAVRILGSWVAAIALMLLAFSLSRGQSA